MGNMWNLFKINNKGTRRASTTYSGVFIVNFWQILRIVLVFFIVDFEQINTG